VNPLRGPQSPLLVTSMEGRRANIFDSLLRNRISGWVVTSLHQSNQFKILTDVEQSLVQFY
jgi:hypothetical protein